LQVAIYGGSFDPPHLGHYEIVIKALETLDIDKLVVLPNFLNPWKRSTQFSPEERLYLLKKIFKEFPKVEVSSFEIDNGYPTKSIESVRHFSKLYQKIYLIIGADNLAKLHLWDDFSEIEKMVTFVVASRGEIAIPEKFIKLDVNIPISSTELREKLDLKKIPKEIREDFNT